jgi:hypothetical protein
MNTGADLNEAEIPSLDPITRKSAVRNPRSGAKTHDWLDTKKLAALTRAKLHGCGRNIVIRFALHGHFHGDSHRAAADDGGPSNAVDFSS